MRCRSTAPLLLAAACSLLAVSASAQPFTVVGTQPADYATGVPLQTTLAFTFSAPVQDAEPLLVLFPTAETGEAVRSADGRTLSVPVALEPDTRYVALLLGADAEDGPGLARAAALNFTTGATNGGFRVRGSVSGTGGVAPDGAIVALVTGDLNTGDVQIVAADVVDGSGAGLPYTLGPVPLGLYTAGAIRIPLPLGSAGSFGYGLYDPDGDGTPNPIFVPNNVDVVLAPPPASTAGEGVDEAQATADEALGGFARLEEVGPAIVDAAGASPVWTYLFTDGTTDGDGVQVVRLGLFTLPVSVPSVEPGCAPVSFIGDSDDALGRAEASGGAAFRAAHPGETITVTMRLTAICDADIWSVTYLASGGDTTTIEVFYGGLAGENGPTDAPRRLALRSANPGRGPVEARLTLGAPAEARVRVVDAQGRTVATLAEGRLGAGEHALRWDARVPAGTFWIVAEADGRTEAVAVTRVR